jgi:hypothetical protein
VSRAPPEFEDFPSRPTPDGAGRLYTVHDGYQLAAYYVADTRTLAKAGAKEGFYVYAFLSGTRVGYWNWTPDVHDLERVMRRFRASVDPDAPRPEPKAPGGEEPTIRPLYNRDPGYTTRNAPLPAARYLDLSPYLEAEPERPPKPVIPFGRASRGQEGGPV